MKWCKINFSYSLFVIVILFWIFIFFNFKAGDVYLNQERDFPNRELLSDTFSPSKLMPCKPYSNIQVLFFNRIAKCASSSFVELLQKLSHVGGYDVIFNGKGAYDWKSHEEVLVTGRIKQHRQENGGRRIAYAQHFYYTDFSLYLKSYGYVTLVREPIDRLISSFNYYHYSTKEHIKRMLPAERREETLLDCVQMEHDGCKHNLMTKYFCGHSYNCSSGSRQALKIAKHNLKNNFMAVGLVENFTLSVQLFQQLLPSFFPPIPAEDLARLLPHTNQNKKVALADSNTIKAITIRNQADIELYQYAKDLFFSRLKGCNIS